MFPTYPRTFTTTARYLKKPQKVLPTRKSPPLPRAHPTLKPQKILHVKPQKRGPENKSASVSPPVKYGWKDVMLGVFSPKSKFFAFAFVMPNHSKRVRMISVVILSVAVTGALLTVWTMDTVVERFWGSNERNIRSDATDSGKN